MALPPEALYAPVPEPTQPAEPMLNSELAEWTLALRKTIAAMNVDRDALRVWVDTVAGKQKGN